MPKVIFVGPAASGKTKTMWELLVGYPIEMNPNRYVATIGAEVHPYEGVVIWDCAGSEKYAGLRDGYYMNADYCVLFGCDTDNDVLKMSPNVVFKRYEDLDDLVAWLRSIH